MKPEWTAEERRTLKRLNSPERIQDYLDTLPYRAETVCCSPRTVMSERRAHCYDGALVAAAAFDFAGQPPLILDLRAVRDDDHVLAVFKKYGRFGAVAKSNNSGLRFREPIHRNLRELALSYFDDYFNVQAEKTLRSYSVLMNLRKVLYPLWMFDDATTDEVSTRLDALPHHELMTPEMIRGLLRVDKRSYDAGMLGANPDGLYKAEK